MFNLKLHGITGWVFYAGFFDKSADVGFDFYRTDFKIKMLLMLQSPQQVLFIT
jgi:hypothetical protein